MKSTIEFDLPEDEDAHLDAAQGAKWKRFASTLRVRLTAQAATEKRVERQVAYDDIRRWLQEEMRTAGLTFYTSQQLQELSLRQQNAWTDELNAHLQKKEPTSNPKNQIERFTDRPWHRLGTKTLFVTVFRQASERHEFCILRPGACRR